MNKRSTKFWEAIEVIAMACVLVCTAGIVAPLFAMFFVDIQPYDFFSMWFCYGFVGIIPALLVCLGAQSQQYQY
jgi:hypothetical protein